MTNKIWSVDEMTYIDTLFGHQSEALTISLLSSAKERFAPPPLYLHLQRLCS